MWAVHLTGWKIKWVYMLHEDPFRTVPHRKHYVLTLERPIGECKEKKIAVCCENITSHTNIYNLWVFSVKSSGVAYIYIYDIVL
jgi:hypothetical protein